MRVKRGYTYSCAARGTPLKPTNLKFAPVLSRVARGVTRFRSLDRLTAMTGSFYWQSRYEYDPIWTYSEGINRQLI